MHKIKGFNPLIWSLEGPNTESISMSSQLGGGRGGGGGYGYEGLLGLSASVLAGGTTRFYPSCPLVRGSFSEKYLFFILMAPLINYYSLFKSLNC